MSFFIRKILIKKSQDELGFSLGGQYPCVVSSVTLEGLADQSQLRCGDQILEVNFINVTHMSCEVVSKNIVRKAAIGNVVLNVRTLYFHNVIGGHCQLQDRMIIDSPGYSLRRSHIKYWHNMASRNNEIVDSENNITKPVETNYLPSIFGLKNGSKPSLSSFEQFDCKVFVFYICSREIRRNENIPAASLDALKSSVVLVKKKEHRHNSFVLFGISQKEISLLNPFGKVITSYPLKNIVFSAVCSDDRNYFAFVYKSILLSEDGTRKARYDCHIFMIDKTICKHDSHKKFAALLDLPCSQNEECRYFPSSSSSILKELNAIYQKRDETLDVLKKPLVMTVSSPEIHPKRDMRKLMISPPSSLASLEPREKEELIKGLTTSQFTRSLTRKPPVPHKVSSDGSLSKKNGAFSILNSMQRGRRKSEGLLKSSGDLNKIQEPSPVRTPLFGRKCDTNENVKRLSLASSASESSINKSCHLVESWANSLENLLGDPIGLRCFQEFLKKEFSEENIQFWNACEEFRKIKGYDKIKLEANAIFQEYLAPNASSLVNVNQSGVKIVEGNLQKPHTDMFATPQNQVFHLMKFDSYNRFLKSDLYKECLEAERSDKRLPYEEDSSTLSRRSRSPIPDFAGDWKKQILNFLSKGGKRSDIKGLRKGFTIGDGCDNEVNISTNFVRHNSLKENQLWDGLHSQSKGNFLRVFFPDGTSTMVVAENGVTLKDTLKDTCKNKKISLTSFDVTMGCPRKIASLEQEISTLNEKVVFLEKRILFRFDLPNGRSVGIKANPNKTLKDILLPVMKRNGFDIQDYSVHILNNKASLSLDSSIAAVENKRLTTRRLHKKLEKQISDTATLKGSGDLRSSLRRLRTNSFNKEEKTKQDTKKEDDSSRTFGNEMKHILLGKTKSEDGTSALMFALQRSQSSRMDDQRGLLLSDLELPDFLKTAPPQTSENDIPPSPRGSINSVTCSPSKSVPCPPSPLIIDKTTHNGSSRSPLLMRSLNSGLFSVTSWKEVASPDRELVDKSYTNTLSSDGYDTQSKPSLLELSRSDPVLSKGISSKSTTINGNHNMNSNQSSKERLNHSSENEHDAFEIVGIDDITSSFNNDNIVSTPKHVTRLGSIDLINYDLSPRDFSKRKLLDPFEENETEPVFLHDAIPTPEKSKLLKGETVLGRKNEKISYV